MNESDLREHVVRYPCVACGRLHRMTVYMQQPYRALVNDAFPDVGPLPPNHAVCNPVCPHLKAKRTQYLIPVPYDAAFHSHSNGY